MIEHQHGSLHRAELLQLLFHGAAKLLILAWMVDEHHVLAGAAVGVIPLTIGLGFPIDYALQKKQVAGMALEWVGFDTMR